MDLNTAYGVLAVIAVLFLLCNWRDRQPVNPARPRILPYKLIMMMLIVAFLAIAAHVVSLITGQPVKPRNKFG